MRGDGRQASDTAAGKLDYAAHRRSETSVRRHHSYKRRWSQRRANYPPLRERGGINPNSIVPHRASTSRTHVTSTLVYQTSGGCWRHGTQPFCVIPFSFRGIITWTVTWQCIAKPLNHQRLSRSTKSHFWNEVNKPLHLDATHPVRMVTSSTRILTVFSYIVCDLTTTLDILLSEVSTHYSGRELGDRPLQYQGNAPANRITQCL